MPAEKASSSTVLALAVVLAACGGGLVPVHNVRGAPIVVGGGEAASPQLVRDAIMRALVSRSWQVDREGPDGIVATQVSRGNAGTVLIQYDARTYSISYLDSSPGLKFNGSAIHRRYNDWVDKLDKTIRRLLATSPAYQGQPAYPVQPPPPAQPAPTAEPAPPLAPVPPPEGAPAVAPQYEGPPPPPPPPPAAAPRR
jgi:hypothetical protein